MITEKLYKQAIEVIKQYRLQQLELLKTLRSKDAITTIPKENWGIHITHCCFEHGCKYGDKDCPVELGLVKQRYKCEQCKIEDYEL